MQMAVIEYNLVPPKFNQGGKISVLKGRNLLVEYQQHKFTKQNFDVSTSTTNVIYGSNGSGKSIHLRNLANIVYLA